MMARNVVRAALAGALLALAGSAHAQQCSGFTDVFASESFCEDVTWLKNRQITQGCTATEYCPTAPVSRLAMAAFMNRLGNVMQPHVMSVEDGGTTLDLTQAQPHTLCETADVPARNYRRKIVGDASLSFAVTGQQGVYAAIVVSIDGGQNWTSIGTNNDFGAGLRGNEEGHQHAHAQTTRDYDGDATIVRRYALQVGREGTFSTAGISSWTCHLVITTTNGDE